MLLNPNERDTIELLKKIDAIDQSKAIAERDESTAQMLMVARWLLKREWVRIKEELA